MKKSSQNNFVKLNFVKVRLWFSQLTHLSKRKQKKKVKEIYQQGVLNTKQITNLSAMLEQKSNPRKHEY